MENLPKSLKYIVGAMAVIGITFASFFIPFFSGSFIGEIINQTEMHYECACDNPPVLTKLQAFIVGIIYMVCLSVGLYYKLRSLDLSRCKRWAWLIVLLILSGGTCFIVIDILSTKVSG